MPRLSQSVPKYQKHRASGQAVVTINGVDRYLGPHGTKASKLEYDRLIMEWLSSGRSASYGAPQHDLTVVELVADYLHYAKGYYGVGPRGTYAHVVRVARPLRALYGRSPAAEFGILQFKALRHSLTGEDRSRSYVNETMQRIVAIFRWGAAEGKIPASVPQTLAVIPGLRKGRTTLREPAPVQPVDPETVATTLPYLSPIVAAMVRWQLLTGARPGEVCKLRAGDVDRSAEVWEARLIEHKTAHHDIARTIYIGPQAQDVLRPYLLRPADAYCFSPSMALEQMRAARAARRKTPLSCGNRAGTNRRRDPARAPGERYTSQSYGVAIGRACDAAFPHPELAGIPRAKLTAGQGAELRAWQKEHRWSPNQLRHALATRVRREFDLDGAKTLLGHTQVTTTQIYAEKDRARAIEIARMIG